ncbi:hypothetical protein DJ568_02005 [Mucilaginibacter hurinus]|uniref:Uncharacterized protein n=1 Tax=Mucilaginibacter hurinus TaxID=2201324 RepID=A0A367GTZ8_9SPHI|nr:polysaccharide biosynthesis/export family protein [Mucilaginibacter hurinus]RCH56658.1 hypothetical protein DJ568_02005 [Mucilaginibacter hurinus]
MRFLSITRAVLLLIVVNTLFSSCSTNLRYFNDLPDSTVVNLKPLPQEERYIQIGDRLLISIGAFNDASAQIFNRYGGELTSGGMAGGARAAGGANSEISGYLVDAQGNVEFPIIGKVKADGLTADGLKNKISNLVKEYLKEPLVTVKFYVFKFTVLGEVRSPGTFSLPMQRTTILDALGAAGDLPRTAKRYDIQIYRDYNGKRTITKIDLRQSALLNNADVFQIKHNDVIYVQPRDSRFAGEEARFYTSLLTVAAGVFILFLRFK